ncbi:MAG: outer membrane protein transport protein [Leptospiraceae bacterium]|nr:outer membrane protein transport protein [Leptospiraceae bacterium]MCP5501096.1 outer membrane protein transport protein [Leptospiraceae bacterium]
MILRTIFGKTLKLVLSIVFIFVSFPLFATNGMLMTAYSAKYAGMGGAGLAIGGTIMDLESNPAHLARIKKTTGSTAILEGGFAALIPKLYYKDSQFDDNSNSGLVYTNSRKSEPAVFPMPYGGFAQAIGDNMGWGIAFYAQGGMGAHFKNNLRNTPNRGTLNEVMSGMTGSTVNLPMIGNLRQMSESTYSNFGYAKITPGFAMKFGNLSVGLGFDVGMAKMEWRWTFSDPFGMMEFPGAGYRYKSDVALGYAGKIGFVYDLSDHLSLAYAYSSGAKLNLNGKISVNAGNADATQAGLVPVSMYLNYPERHATGIAYNTGGDGTGLTIGFNVSYIKWASAINTVEFKIPMPYISTPMGNKISELAFNMKWRDQTVFALGFEYKPSKDSVAYRLGYNYGRSPVTADGINPLFPAVSEHHASTGLGFTFGGLELDLAVEYAFPNTVKGNDMSDWDMLHAFYLTPGASTPGTQEFLAAFKNIYYNHSVKMEQITTQVGIRYKF